MSPGWAPSTKKGPVKVLPGMPFQASRASWPSLSKVVVRTLSPGRSRITGAKRDENWVWNAVGA